MDTYNVRLKPQVRKRLQAARLAFSCNAGRVITMSETIEWLLDLAASEVSEAAK
jgi:hypothetical protein